MSWEGRAVVVTGGAMGIGRYIALGAAERGASVAVADIDEAALASVEKELAAIGHKVLALSTDVRNEAAVAELMSRTAATFGGIDYLVNNAGIVPHFQWGVPRWPTVEHMDRDFFCKVLDTNLVGSFLCAKHAIPYLAKSASGHICNLYGGGGVSPPGALAYVITKEALVVFTRYLAEEVRELGICVVSLSPGGAIATERAPAEARARMPGPVLAGDRFLLAGDASMELSGHLVDLAQGELVIADSR